MVAQPRRRAKARWRIFKNTQIVYNLHHPENEGTADTAKILELLGLPDDVDINKLTDHGKVDLLKLGLMHSDHVVTGNYLKDEFDEVFKELGITPKQIQGSPEDVSNKFADYYKVITE